MAVIPSQCIPSEEKLAYYCTAWLLLFYALTRLDTCVKTDEHALAREFAEVGFST